MVIDVQQTQVLLIKKYIIIDPSNIQTSMYFCQQPLKLFLPWLADNLVIQGLLEFIWKGGCSRRSSNPGPALSISLVCTVIQVNFSFANSTLSANFRIFFVSGISDGPTDLSLLKGFSKKKSLDKMCSNHNSVQWFGVCPNYRP